MHELFQSLTRFFMKRASLIFYGFILLFFVGCFDVSDVVKAEVGGIESSQDLEESSIDIVSSEFSSNMSNEFNESSEGVSNSSSSDLVNESSSELFSISSSVIDSKGYYLFSPLGNTAVHLIDSAGDVVHQWNTEYVPALSVYLLEDGTLLRAESMKSKDFSAGGSGGRVALYDASSNEIWSYEYADSEKLLHHDIEMLPNGNILMVAWEKYSADDAVQQGLNTELFSEDEIWADHIIEVDPTTDEIVWQWHVWDHMVQDHDASKENFGSVQGSLGKIDLNYMGSHEVKDWNHINSIDYNEELDQILVSVHSFSEVWIIDHAITTEEATTDKGDLLYRWGNPDAVQQDGERELFYQHDAEWIDNDRILVFNNGDRVLQPYSSILEIQYTNEEVVGKTEVLWEYASGESFYATNISGAQRLANGNTLICDGPSGYFFEVAEDGTITWEYTNPYVTTTPMGEMNQVFRVDNYTADFSGIIGLLE